MTEREMRDFPAPWPKSLDELNAFIQEITVEGTSTESASMPRRSCVQCSNCKIPTTQVVCEDCWHRLVDRYRSDLAELERVSKAHQDLIKRYSLLAQESYKAQEEHDRFQAAVWVILTEAQVEALVTKGIVDAEEARLALLIRAIERRKSGN
jgi:hypothetical protein